jgi:hypothetical protein
LEGSRELSATELRARLVETVLEWERRFAVAPHATSALSEFDAAMLVGHTPETFAHQAQGRTAVSRGTDFDHEGVGYQVKANRPSGKPGSFVTLVAKASNYEWDRLIWILYDREFHIEEAWLWSVADYMREFDNVKRLGPSHMRRGERLR